MNTFLNTCTGSCTCQINTLTFNWLDSNGNAVSKTIGPISLRKDTAQVENVNYGMFALSKTYSSNVTVSTVLNSNIGTCTYSLYAHVLDPTVQ